MRRFLVCLSTLVFAGAACQGSVPATSAPIEPLPATTVAPVTSVPQSTATETPPAETSISTPDPGVIHVDTLEQDAYPFVENGKCSLGEAIFAANAGAPQDSCAAGAATTFIGLASTMVRIMRISKKLKVAVRIFLVIVASAPTRMNKRTGMRETCRFANKTSTN